MRFWRTGRFFWQPQKKYKWSEAFEWTFRNAYSRLSWWGKIKWLCLSEEEKVRREDRVYENHIALMRASYKSQNSITNRHKYYKEGFEGIYKFPLE